MLNVSAEESTNMKTSQAGVDYIKSVEGFSKYPYYDYGQYTVGYGTRCPADKYNEYKTNGITEEAAEELLRKFLEYTENEVNVKIIQKYNLTLTQGQFDALVSLSFNIGTSWMTSSKNSILRNAITNPEATSNDIAYAFALYCNAGGQVLPGLVTRRLTEANMFINSNYERGDKLAYIYYDANGGNVEYRIHGFDVSFDNAVVTASKDGAEFLGWYTQPDGGEKIEKLTVDLHQKTLFANWSNCESTAVSVTVTSDGVNVRSGPGTNYEKVGYLEQGRPIVVTHVTHITNTIWGKFENGWVALSYTNYEDVINGNDSAETPETPVEEEILYTGVVDVDDSLRIRSGPGTNYSITGYLQKGDAVNIYQKQTIQEMEWGRIGKDKWVSLTYIIINDNAETPDNNEDETSSETTEPPVNEDPLSPPPETIVPTEPETPTEPDIPDTPQEPVPDDPTPPEQTEPPVTQPDEKEEEESKPLNGRVKVNDSLRVRSGPGLSYSTVGYLSNNTKVVIYEQTNANNMTWGKIADDKWVSLTYVTIEQTPENPSTPAEPAETITGIINVQQSLRVRSGPGTNNSIVGYLGPKQKVTITETKMVGPTKWGKIADNKWISMDYVIIQGDSTSESEPQQTVTKTIVADCLRIRSGAGTNYSIVGYLYQNNTVTIYETKNASDGSLWGRTAKGWISMSYTK